MGLLTNAKTQKKIVSLISSHNNKLCFLFYVVGLSWFLGLAYRPLNAGTYFSENALLPGLVEAGFHHDHGAGSYLKSLREEIKSFKTPEQKQEQYYRIPGRWLENEFRNLGLDTYVQNFTFKYPVNIAAGQEFGGQNIYGILRAPKTASTEAIVLSAPYRVPEDELATNNHGIALMLAMAKAFRRHTFWAKDIIFLVTEFETLGMQAWLQAYHDHRSEFIKSDELRGRSGKIQAALNLELSSEQVHRMNMKIEGINGQLPNLDLVNTIVRLCRRENVYPTIQNRTDTFDWESLNGFMHNLQTMMSMMMKQASGSPTGNHGLFHRYHIEAVTLQGIKLRGWHSSAGFSEIGRVIEGVCRSLNNLLEQFHQSFFFYLLPSTERYVSIGLYMPPFGLLAAPILIKAVALWISYTFVESSTEDTTSNDKDSDKGKNDDSAAGDAKEKTSEKKKKDKKDLEEKDSKKGEKDKETNKQEGSGFVELIPTSVMCLLFGMAALYGPVYFTPGSRAFMLKPQDTLTLGALALQISSMLFPKLLQRKAREKGHERGPDPSLQKCVALLAVGLVLAATSLVNISLAFFVTLAWAPIFLIIYPRKSRLANFLQYILLLIASPMGLLFIFCVSSSVFQVASVSGLSAVSTSDALLSAWTMLQNAVLVGIIDSDMMGCWTYNLIGGAMFPCWLMFWSLMWTG